jgi:hypothetical protein
MAAGCLGDFMLWEVVLPCAIAFVVGAYLLSIALFIDVMLVILAAVCVVFVTATVGSRRAKRAAIERRPGDERGARKGGPK